MNSCSTKCPCTIKILAIIEANAAAGEHSFNLLLDAVRNWRGLGYRFVVEEHSHQDGPIDDGLTKDVDQLWFFGTELSDDIEKPTVRLTDAEVGTITKRMKEGVGVFATGDHMAIGSGLCERIPFVADMRVWKGAGAPEQLPPYSYESTIRSPYADLIDPDPDIVIMDKCNSPDERDALPKPVWVMRLPNGAPHELMQLPLRGVEKSAIRFLPDHMHEGKLLDYDEKDSNGNPVLAAPVGFFANTRSHIVARSVRTIFGAKDKPVDCTSYPVVAAYEPNTDTWGNVVVDSTFHHWTDSNALRTRFSPAWLHVEQYAINVANWLLGAVGRDRVKPCVESYIIRTMKKGEEYLAKMASGDKGAFDKLVEGVGARMYKQRIVADTLERILVGAVVSSNPARVATLIKQLQLPELDEKELDDLQKRGDLQNAFLALQFEKLRVDAGK